MNAEVGFIGVNINVAASIAAGATNIVAAPAGTTAGAAAYPLPLLRQLRLIPWPARALILQCLSTRRPGDARLRSGLAAASPRGGCWLGRARTLVVYDS